MKKSQTKPTYNKVRDKIRKFSAENKSNKDIIRQIGETYIVFDKYAIAPSDGVWIVEKNHNHAEYLHTRPLALLWSLANHAKKIELCWQIKNVDRQLTQKIRSAYVLATQLKAGVPAEKRDIMYCKLTESLARIKEIKSEIENYQEQVNTYNLTKEHIK